MIHEDSLKIVSGGKLKEGWQDAVLAMIARNKNGYDSEEGKRYIKFIVRAGSDLFESYPNEWDLRAVDSFIDEHYDSVEPIKK
jgi:hypothetical protein